MSHEHHDVAAVLERLYPPVIAGLGWEDVLDRLGDEDGSPEAAVQERVARRNSRRSMVVPLAAVVATAVLAAGPALALSPKMRELVGLTTNTRPPVFIAR